MLKKIAIAAVAFGVSGLSLPTSASTPVALRPALLQQSLPEDNQVDPGCMISSKCIYLSGDDHSPTSWICEDVLVYQTCKVRAF